MRLCRSAALLLLISFIIGIAPSCAEKSGHEKGWKATVFYPGQKDVVIAWMTKITDRDPMDFKPLENGSVGLSKDSVYVGGRSKNLYRLSRRTGKVLKKRRMEAEIFSKPVVQNDLVYFGSATGKLHAMELLSLKDRWVFDAKSQIIAPVVVDGDTLYFISQNDTLTALDAITGKFKWEYNEEYHGNMSIHRRAVPLVVGDRIYQGFTNGVMCALDKMSGKLLWRTSLGSGRKFDDVNASPFFYNGNIYTASFDNGVFCLDAENGIEQWFYKIKSASAAYVIDDKVYFTASESGLYCLEAIKGKLDWFMDFKSLYKGHDEGALSAPVLFKNEYLVFAASGTALYFLDFRNNRLSHRFAPRNGFSEPPTIEGNMIYTLSNGGYVYGISLGKKGVSKKLF